MTIKAGVAVPLKFSNLNKGARIMDEISVKQANMNVEEARLLIQADVMQAYSDFIYAERQSRTFSDKMLDDMNKVVEGKKKAYEVGETPFIEFLIAERSRNEMKKEYTYNFLPLGDPSRRRNRRWQHAQHRPYPR